MYQKEWQCLKCGVKLPDINVDFIPYENKLHLNCKICKFSWKAFPLDVNVASKMLEATDKEEHRCQSWFHGEVIPYLKRAGIKKEIIDEIPELPSSHLIPYNDARTLD